MSATRLSLFLEDHPGLLPESGEIAVMGAVAGLDLSGLPGDKLRVVARMKPDVDHLDASGLRVVADVPQRVALAIVIVPRAKSEARALVAAAMACAGEVIVDGQKTDGIDSLFREMRQRCACGEAYSKAHGKTFLARGTAEAFTDWAQAGGPRVIEGGFTTRAGVFSADGIDPASRLLAVALPERPGAHVVDLGGGWGYLAAAILERGGVEQVDLVEADRVALDCARENLSDGRVRFHWADATRWMPETRADAVVMNPPFHEGRKGQPELGARFIAQSARMLAPGGRLWMVANRHLPYEKALRTHFREVAEIGGDPRFKVFCASGPSRTGG
ncbi:class I SAM-dependent methyltransferase [Aquicoccus sp.]|uniref:class I SAM-dependent methyltransferase n=1 Tax=Aquicoccus sp. TaxID=2055851 RepID=UPI00356733C2